MTDFNPIVYLTEELAKAREEAKRLNLALLQQGTMITDEERQLLVVLVSKSWVAVRDDHDMEKATAELESILRKISGTDKRIIVHG